MTKTLVSILIFVITIGYVFFFVTFLPKAVDDYFRMKRRRKLRKTITEILKKGSLTRKQIEIMVADNYLSHRDILLIARRGFSKAAEEAEDEERDSLMTFFQSLFEELEKDEPFDGLPSDVRIHLERVRETVGKEKDHLLQPLAGQLQDLNSASKKKERWMIGLTVAGLLVGIIGAGFGAFPYFKNPKIEEEKVNIESSMTEINTSQ
jgi:hypothetical protein